MSVKILRRPQAVQDAEDIANFIAQDSMEPALRFLENLESTLRQMAASPTVGSPFSVSEAVLKKHPEFAHLRFRRVNRFPKHVIFYLEHKREIEVLRILHGARDLDAVLRLT